MTVEIRAATGDEMVEYSRVAQTALGVANDTPWSLSPELTLCAFENGRIATTYLAWPYTMYFNGKDAAVAGIAAVGTLPVYRRRGYLRKVVAAHCQRMHEQGEQSIAILWPSQAAIYQRYGYAVVAARYGYSIDRRDLQFTAPQPVTGSFFEVDESLSPMREVYHQFCAERTGYLHRDDSRWQRLAPSPVQPGRLLIRVAYQEEGRPLGYMVYDVESTGPGHPNQRVTIRDMAWLTLSAHQALWDYLAGMDLVGTITWRDAAEDDPLPHLVLEPRQLNVTVNNGIMGRIVDVERALPLRGYPVAARLTFEIRDELCPWNSGRWELMTEGGQARVRRTESSAQVVMPASTLALLAFNRVSATEAARMGRLDVLDQSALATWDRVMETTFRPCCSDHF